MIEKLLEKNMFEVRPGPKMGQRIELRLRFYVVIFTPFS